MEYTSILPELVLFVGALTLLMVDVFLGKKLKNPANISFLISLIFSIATLAIVVIHYNETHVAFNNGFFTNKFTSFVKIGTLSLLILTLLICDKFVLTEKKISSEFLSLMMMSVTGSMLLISSNDLLPFYMALELQSLSLYILAAIKRKSAKSSESGMKYFLLGSVASGILLLGISMVYGFSGTTNFSGLFYLIENGNISIGILLGLTLILVALLFKISAVPFHMWTPDVYEGSPTVITTFFAGTIKFVSVLVLVRIYINIINIWPDINQVLIVVAILSLLIGSLGAIRQNNLKRMLAYSGIGHIGFMLCGLAAVNIEAIQATITYISIYATLSIGMFAFLTILVSTSKESDADKKNDKLYELSSIAALSKRHPIIAMSVAALMFSMAGIPPFGGFFAKFYIILAIVAKEFYYLAIIAVAASIISAFYYLRIIKIMYFDDKRNEETEISAIGTGSVILVVMALINLLALAFINPLSTVINNILL